MPRGRGQKTEWWWWRDLFWYLSLSLSVWTWSGYDHSYRASLESKLMGLAVYNSIILDLHFPTACYKKLLSPPVVPQDVKSSTLMGTADVTLDDFAEVMPVNIALLLNTFFFSFCSSFSPSFLPLFTCQKDSSCLTSCIPCILSSPFQSLPRVLFFWFSPQTFSHFSKSSLLLSMFFWWRMSPLDSDNCWLTKETSKKISVWLSR